MLSSGRLTTIGYGFRCFSRYCCIIVTTVAAVGGGGGVVGVVSVVAAVAVAVDVVDVVGVNCVAAATAATAAAIAVPLPFETCTASFVDTCCYRADHGAVRDPARRLRDPQGVHRPNGGCLRSAPQPAAHAWRLRGTAQTDSQSLNLERAYCCDVVMLRCCRLPRLHFFLCCDGIALNGLERPVTNWVQVLGTHLYYLGGVS